MRLSSHFYCDFVPNASGRVVSVVYVDHYSAEGKQNEKKEEIRKTRKTGPVGPGLSSGSFMQMGRTRVCKPSQAACPGC